MSQALSSGATGKSDAGKYDPYIFIIAFIIASGFAGLIITICLLSLVKNRSHKNSKNNMKERKVDTEIVDQIKYALKNMKSGIWGHNFRNRI